MWLRMAMLIGFLAFVVEGFRWLDEETPGRDLFDIFIFVNAVVLVCFSCVYFSTAITEEKADENLALMRMSGMTPFVILFGKGASRMISALHLLIAQAPYVLLTVALGGIGYETILKAYAILGSFLVFATGLGLFCSVVRPTNGTAITCSIIAMLTPVCAAAAIEIRIDYSAISEPLESYLTAVVKFCHLYNPIRTFSGDVLNTTDISWDVTVLCGTGVFFFLAAWLLFERCCHAHAEPGPARGAAGKPQQVESPRRATRQPGGRAWPCAFIWKDFVIHARGWRGLCIRWGVGSGIILFFCCVTWNNGGFSDPETIGLYFRIIGILLFLGDGLALTCSLQWKDVTAKTLSTLVLTPKAPWTILLQQFAGSAMALIPAASFFFIGYWLEPPDLREFDYPTDSENLLFLSHIVFIFFAVQWTSLATRTLPIIWVAIFGFITCLEIVIAWSFMRTEAGNLILSWIPLAGTMWVLYKLPGALEKAAASEA